MFNSTPIAAQVMTSEDPPWLIKGRGMPVVGTKFTTTLMFNKACMTRPAVNPIPR